MIKNRDCIANLDLPNEFYLRYYCNRVAEYVKINQVDENVVVEQVYNRLEKIWHANLHKPYDIYVGGENEYILSKEEFEEEINWENIK